MTEHFPVDRCTSIRPVRFGWLCNCGRTILGADAVKEHFGEAPELKKPDDWKLQSSFDRLIGKDD